MRTIGSITLLVFFTFAAYGSSRDVEFSCKAQKKTFKDGSLVSEKHLDEVLTSEKGGIKLVVDGSAFYVSICTGEKEIDWDILAQDPGNGPWNGVYATGSFFANNSSASGSLLGVKGEDDISYEYFLNCTKL